MHKKHSVKIRGWENGELVVATLFFNSYNEAVDFASGRHHRYGHSAKIYNELNELVLELIAKIIGSYA